MANKSQFDLKVHQRDAKGHIKRANHYRLTIKNGIKEFERPPGSGLIYAENGELIRTEKKQVAMATAPEAKSFNEQELLAQIEELKAKLAEKEVVGEGEEIHQTVDDVKTDDVVGSADLSEEIALMKEAGVDTTELESKKPLFSKPSFLK